VSKQLGTFNLTPMTPQFRKRNITYCIELGGNRKEGSRYLGIVAGVLLGERGNGGTRREVLGM
jgi:hypothetical protein